MTSGGNVCSLRWDGSQKEDFISAKLRVVCPLYLEEECRDLARSTRRLQRYLMYILVNDQIP